MSNARFETYETDATVGDLHSAETVGYGHGYGVPGPPGEGARRSDTYRPAYERTLREQPMQGQSPPEPTLLERTPVEQTLVQQVQQVQQVQRVQQVQHRQPTEPALPRQAALAPEAAPEDGPATARSGHRRRARYAERAEGMRRLLPQALVVACLTGGTTAFLADDKEIELTVDGTPRTLHTFADDVTELLADEGIQVGPHDVVSPGPGEELEHGDEIEVRYGRPLLLTLDGERREVWTTAHTVEGALRQLGVRAEGAYVSASRSRRIGREGLALDVRTERTVTVMADGRARTVRTNAATVREAVEQAGVTLRGLDTTSVPPGSFPREGQTVTVLRITRTREVHEEPIPFHEVRTEDPALLRGTEVVERPGQPGLRRVTYSVRTVNGVRQRPRRLHAEVVREPRAQVVKVGTGTPPASVAGADHLNWGALAACESGGRPDAVDPSGTYGGLYQFDTATWQSLGGQGRPQDASPAEQTYRAKKLYLRSGTSPWPHCGSRLGG